MRLMVEAGLLALCAILFLLMTAVAVKAQNAAPSSPAPAAASPPMEEEIIVNGRRNQPSFQEEWEHHAREYDRLRKIYGPADRINSRVDRMTDTPNPDAGKSVMRSPSAGTVQGRSSSPVDMGGPAARF